MQVNYFLIFLYAFLLSIFLVYLLKKLSFKTNLLITKNITHIGGLAIGLSFIFTTQFVYFTAGIFPKEIKGIIIASSVMLLFGIVDDLKELSVRVKFLVQIISIIILIVFGLATQIIYLGYFNLAITFLWMLGIINAFNHLDVLDGLAGGTAVIVGLTFFLTTLLNSNLDTAILVATLIGAVSGFLVFNLPPAKIYMGNSGSHFLGFVLAAIAIMISYAPLERKTALLSPILILGLPIFDTTFLIFMRIKQGKSAFKKSDDHFAWRILKNGYSKNTTLLLMLILCFFYCFFGFLVSRVYNLLGIIVISFVILISLVLTIKMSKNKSNYA